MLTSLPNFLCAGVLGPLLLTGLFAGEVPVAVTAVFTALAWATAAVVAALPLLLGRIDPDKSSGRIMHRVRAAALVLANGIRDPRALL